MDRIELEESDLTWAAAQGLLTREQGAKLWRALLERRALDGAPRVSMGAGTVVDEPFEDVRRHFDLVHVAWYGGALLIIGALGWFATLGFERWGGPGMLAIASLYVAVFTAVGVALWRTATLKIPGGLLVAAAVSTVPLAVYGLERTLGLWPDVDPGAYGHFYDWVSGGWFGIELSGVVAGILAVRRVPFSFVLLPVAIFVWFISMDLTPLLSASATEHAYEKVSALVGAATLLVVWIMRARQAAHLTYWLEVAGVVSLDVGLASMHSGNLWTKVPFLAIQLGLLAVGLRIRRGIFIIAGTLGTIGVSAWAFSVDREDRALACGLMGVPLLAFALACQRLRWDYGAVLGITCGAGVLAAGPYTAWENQPSGLALYTAWNVAFIALGVFVRARSLTAIGGLAVTAVLGRLAHHFFEDSMVFPLVLVSLGIGFLVLGMKLERSRAAIDGWVESRVPRWLRVLRPPP